MERASPLNLAVVLLSRRGERSAATCKAAHATTTTTASHGWWRGR